MTATEYQVSPFLYIGSSTFERANGTRAVPVYRTRDASVVLVSARVADVLRSGDIASAQLTPLQVADLSSAGLLCNDRDRERDAVYADMAAQAQRTDRRTFVLLPTSYCNMGCVYCGQEHVKGGLSQDHRAEITNRVLGGIAAPSTNYVKVGWFGGEPLMAFAVLRSMSQTFIAAAQEHDVQYESDIVTNGALLDHRKLSALVRECAVRTFHITLDGFGAVHDGHRPLNSGGRSFDKIISTLLRGLADPDLADVRFVLRTNVDVRNSDDVSYYLEQMAALGFAEQPSVVFSLVPVYPWTNDISALEVSRTEFAAREVDWIRQMAALGLNHQLVPGETKRVVCEAVTRSMEIIGSDGSVFSCTEHPLVPLHQKESVLIPVEALGARRLRPKGRYDDWIESVSEHRVPCGTCWLLPVCGGHCPKAWDDGNAPCPSMKFNMDDRLAMVAQRRGLHQVSASHGGLSTGHDGAGRQECW